MQDSAACPWARQVSKRRSGGATLEDAWGNVSIHDALEEQAVGLQSNGRETSSARLAWFYEFEPTRAQDKLSKEHHRLGQAVDDLLATDSL